MTLNINSKNKTIEKIMFTIRAARFTFELLTDRGELKIMKIEDRLRMISTKWRKPQERISFDRNIRNLFLSENTKRELPSSSKSIFLSISFLNAYFLNLSKNFGIIKSFKSFFEIVASTDLMSISLFIKLFWFEICFC